MLRDDRDFPSIPAILRAGTTYLDLILSTCGTVRLRTRHCTLAAVRRTWIHMYSMTVQLSQSRNAMRS